MTDPTTMSMTLRRYKGGTWFLHVKYPDGSWETRKGMVDDGEAASAAAWAIAKVERAAASPAPSSSPNAKEKP